MEIKSYNILPREALDIRITVFVDEQGFCDEVDEIDSIATHLVMFDKGKPIATCRIFQGDDKNEYILGRLCVLKEHRGMGLGSKMVRAAEKEAKLLGGKSLILHSQYQAKDFYAGIGYLEYGEIEDEQGCPHIWMRKDV